MGSLAKPLQCSKVICGHFADAFQPLFMLTIFFFVNPAKKPRIFQTLNMLQHKAIEFMAMFFDATLAQTHALAWKSPNNDTLSQRGSRIGHML